jgi:hypothetical protein
MERLQEEASISLDKINEMEEKRISMLEEAGIDELTVLDNALDDDGRWQGFFSENITRGKDDVQFLVKDQWTSVERSEFNRLFKPAMTANMIYPEVKKILAEQRQNKPDLMVRSLNGKASQDQITLRADMVRTISYQSQNDLIYQHAFKSALTMGYGAFEIGIEYENPRSFKKIISYRLIPDVTQTTFDPSAVKPHKGDGNFCSRKIPMSKQEFYATYPYAINPESYVDVRSLLDLQWHRNDAIVICDYYKKEWKPIIVYLLSNGESVTEEEWEKIKDKIKFQEEIATQSSEEVKRIIRNEIPEIIGERQSQDFKIMHYRLLKNQVLDFSEWPSKYLPLIFVDGDSSLIEGRQYTKSFISDSKDVQKAINYNFAEIMTEIKNRRREQWLATPDNIKGYEQMWRNPEVQNGVLVAQPDPKTGMMPVKQPPSEVPQTLLVNHQRLTQDLRVILGFSQSENMQGIDISGKARRERKTEGSMSAYVFFDNANQAIEQGGRVVLDLLPFVYNEQRDMVITKQSGKTQTISLNDKDENGNIENAMDYGDYDIEIDTGPSFAVQKEIALEFFQQTIAASGNPQVFSLVADLWAENLDIENGPQIVERLKTMVPPQIIAKEEGKELPPQPPSPQEQMMQMEMQDKMQQLQERHRELNIREQQHELEKAQLLLKAKELQDRMQMDKIDKVMDIRKTNMDYTSEITRTLADLHKHFNQQI